MKGFIGDVRFYDYINLLAKANASTFIGSLADVSGGEVPTLYVNVGKLSDGLPAIAKNWKPLIHTVTATGANITYPGDCQVKIEVDNTGDTLIRAICTHLTMEEVKAAGWTYTVEYPLEDVGVDLASALDGKVDYVVQVWTHGTGTNRADSAVCKKIDPDTQVGFTLSSRSEKPVILVNVTFKDQTGWDYLVPTRHGIMITGYYSNARATRSISGAQSADGNIFDSPLAQSLTPEPEDDRTNDASEGGE